MALQFGLNEGEAIALMRDQLKTRSFRVWRMRMRRRNAEHGDLQKLSMQSRNHGPHFSVQNMALGDLQEEDFPTPSSPLTSASLR
jgi:uncharacterized protein (TIGR03643 family)